MSATDFQVAFVAGKPPSVSGRVRAPLVLTVGGRQALVESVSLDSPAAKQKTAKRWGDRFNLDPAAVEQEFDRLGRAAMAKDAENRQRREQAVQTAEPVSAVADRFIADLRPEWHRAGKSLYLGKAKREVPLGQLWSHLTDEWIGVIARTKEAIESDSTAYRNTIALFRDAVAIAAAKAIASLPEHRDVKADATVNMEELRSQLIGWLIRVRTYRLDNGNAVATSYYEWATSLPVDEPWQKCFSDLFFGKRENGQTLIAVKGEFLASELRRDSCKKLASDLTETGLANTDAGVKIAGRKFRVWSLSSGLLDAIAVAEGTDDE